LRVRSEGLGNQMREMMKLRDIRDLRDDDQGAIIVFWAVTLVVVLGIVALSFDFGKKASTQSELQSFADQVALAAAGELDGKSDAITRATNAAANLIVDQQTFATGARLLSGSSDYTLTFYKTLPASDTASIDPGVTTDPAKARYARALAVPRTVPFSFTGAFDVLRGGTTANPAIGAVAVAGFTQYACDITPLMFCIPSPSFKAKDNIGKMILLRSGGQGAAWGPGDFGFLDVSSAGLDSGGPCAGLNGAQQTRCLIGSQGALTQCFSQRGVDTEPGQKVGIENSAYNVRFDIFAGGMSSKKNDANYPAAPNVIKGIVPKGNGSSCIANNSKTSPDTVALPQDNCFYTSTCANGGRFGDGNWSNATTGRPNYVTKNYGAGVADPHSTATTRYQYYKAEVAAAGGGASTTAILPAGRAESGRPQCTNKQSSDPDRRVVIAAGIDCSANPINGRTTGVPVNEFVRLFLTQPVADGTGNSFDIYVEVVGSAETGGGSGSGGIFHDVVQLYR
jgi:Flp pilus assembly protein TadG